MAQASDFESFTKDLKAQSYRICFTFIASIWEDGKLTKGANALLEWLEENARFVRIGYEIAPTTGREHWQGYAELKKLWRKAALRKLAVTSFNWSVRSCNGDQAANLKYCSKERNYIDHGVLEVKKPGKRTDLDRMRATLATSGMRGVVEGGASYQAIRHAQLVVTYIESKRNWKPVVIYIQGGSGIGKSLLAHELASSLFPGDCIYTKSDNSKWFDQYDAHPVVILDDFRDSWWTLTESLSLVDRYARRVECKGGSRQLLARVMIMTSVNDFPSMYKQAEAKGEDPFQFRRRFDRVVTLKNDYSPNVDVSVSKVAGNNRAATSVTDFDESYESLLSRTDEFLSKVNVTSSYEPCKVMRRARVDVKTYTEYCPVTLKPISGPDAPAFDPELVIEYADY